MSRIQPSSTGRSGTLWHAADRRRLLVVAAVAAFLACGRDAADHPLAATRGYLLISIDTLRADHLGCYGHERDTSPFIDSLAGRGVLFENAYVQLPSTLVSHMSIFTGLYPGEHGVFPPEGALSEDIETLPEVFKRHGFRTAGHTEGGWLHGNFGFARGFDEYNHEALRIETDIERTLARGLEFLKRLGADERFFLFLHTYTVHDPYYPDESHLRHFWQGPVPETFDPTGPNLLAVNRGQLELSPEDLEYCKAAYEASIRYADGVLADFFAELDALGLADELTVVFTSDHGEEFREHGKMVHEQIYPETLHVPLIVLNPGIEGPRRVRSIARSIDLAPTLYELAGLAPSTPTSGKSLVPLLAGREGEEAESEAYAEAFVTPGRALIRQRGEATDQLLVTGTDSREPTWVVRRRLFDLFGDRLRFEALSFHEPRSLRIEVDGETVANIELSSTEWTRVDMPLERRSIKRQIGVSSDSCTVPAELGLNADRRCLSFLIRGIPLRSLELYELEGDPAASRDLAASEPDLVRELLTRLDDHRHEPRATPEARELDPELEARLKGLGYLQ